VTSWSWSWSRSKRKSRIKIDSQGNWNSKTESRSDPISNNSRSKGSDIPHKSDITYPTQSLPSTELSAPVAHWTSLSWILSVHKWLQQPKRTISESLPYVKDATPAQAINQFTLQHLGENPSIQPAAEEKERLPTIEHPEQRMSWADQMADVEETRGQRTRRSWLKNYRKEPEKKEGLPLAIFSLSTQNTRHSNSQTLLTESSHSLALGDPKTDSSDR
jgi:hypothetical protein